LVTEYSGTTSDTYSRKDPLDLTLPTTEPAFYLHNFLSTAPDKQSIPKTKFTAGDDVHFTWESNGTYFQLYDGDGATLYEGSGTSYTLPMDKILSDTTFTLKASMTSGAQKSNDVQPVNQYATITITINNPTLHQMTVTDNLDAGDLTVGQLTTHATDRLIVGKLTVQSELDVHGPLNADALIAKHDLRADHNVTVSGDLSVSGKVASAWTTILTDLFENPIQLKPVLTQKEGVSSSSSQKFTCDKDGILIILTPDFEYRGTIYGYGDNYLLSIMGNKSAFDAYRFKKGATWYLTSTSPDRPTPIFYWLAFR
ncbi:hypothetical protein, partial [Nonomuraea diastatica]|uniref:hypothetical protein n=1 Tax=Nonomuraea diastatica TaxID=1848329 RepID=UPI001C700342